MGARVATLVLLLLVLLGCCYCSVNGWRDTMDEFVETDFFFNDLGELPQYHVKPDYADLSKCNLKDFKEYLTVDIKEVPKDWQKWVNESRMLFSPSFLPANIQELMATIGNGYVSTRIFHDSIYLAGVFSGYLNVTPSHRARIPSTVNFTVDYNVTDYGFSELIGLALDLEYAVFYMRTNYTSKQSNNDQSPCGAVIEQRWYAHQEYRQLLVSEIIVTPWGYNNSQNTTTMTIPLLNTPGPFSADIAFTSYRNSTSDSSPNVFDGLITKAETNTSLQVQIGYSSSPIPSTLTVSTSSSSTFYFLSTFRTSLDSTQPALDSFIDFQSLYKIRTTLYSSHINAMTSHHTCSLVHLTAENSTIAPEIEKLSRAVNSSLYYILSAIRQDWPWGLSPGGLASNGYNGHSFWDTETWMYPTILIFYPELAKALLEYRFHTISGAQIKAQGDGYRGSMFAWESAFTGQDCTPTWAATGKYEQHITGDIALAIKNYWYVTRDQEWAKDSGVANDSKYC